MNSYGFVYFLIISHASADNSICSLNRDKKSNNELDIYVFVFVTEGISREYVSFSCLLVSFDEKNILL